MNICYCQVIYDSLVVFILLNIVKHPQYTFQCHNTFLFLYIAVTALNGHPTMVTKS